MITTKDRSNEFLSSNDLIIDNQEENENENEDYIDIISINEEFDYLINELHRKLQFAKEERKQSEKEATVLQHRVRLLHIQEKTANQKFESTKSKLERILENRKYFNDNSFMTQTSQGMKQKKLIEMKEENKKSRYGNIKSYYNFSCKSNSSSDLKVIKQIRDYSQNRKVFKQSRIEVLKKEECERVKEEERKKEILEKKMILKERILKKIQEDENERMVLENQLARVEKDEMNIIKNFRGDKEDQPYSNTLDLAYNTIKFRKDKDKNNYNYNRYEDELFNIHTNESVMK